MTPRKTIPRNRQRRAANNPPVVRVTPPPPLWPFEEAQQREAREFWDKETSRD